MAEFRFTNLHSPASIAGVIDVLRQPRLWIPTEKDYPRHHEWLEKTEAEIVSGKKVAMTAYIGTTAVGTTIYQRDPRNPTILEIKNISLAPDFGGRYFGSMLVRNTEIEAVTNDFPGVSHAIVDTKLNNAKMIRFLEQHHYEPVEICNLYDDDSSPDVVLSKPLG